MFYTIYRITNLLNGKTYIGKHKTDNLEDGYMGSGKLIRRAIQKHGLENFKKEILFVFDNEEDMNTKEKELVNEEYLSSGMTYNLCPGGEGGFGYINSNSALIEKRDTTPGYYAAYAAMTDSEKNRRNGLRSKELKYGLFNPNRKNHWIGRKHSEETKQKMRLAKQKAKQM